MRGGTKMKWFAGLLGVIAVAGVAVVVGLTVEAAQESRAVDEDIRVNQAGSLPPAERVALAERLRAAADRPGLTPRERARRLDAAGLAFTWAGRSADAKPLFRAEYDLLRDAAGPDEVIWVLNSINNCTPVPRTAAELDELRQNHATIRALAAGASLRASAALVVDSSPANFAGKVEAFVTQAGDSLGPDDSRRLLDEAVALREQAVGRPGQPDNAVALFRLAEALARRGDTGRAAVLFEKAAALPGADDGQATALLRLLELRHPDRADPRRAAAVRAWLAGRPAGESTAAVEQELGFCLLESKQYPEAATVFRRLADREEAKPAPDRGVLSYNLLTYTFALDGCGRQAEADAVRRRLAAEFSDTPSGQHTGRTAPKP